MHVSQAQSNAGVPIFSNAEEKGPLLGGMQARCVQLISAKEFAGSPLLPPGRIGFFAKFWNTLALWAKGGEMIPHVVGELPVEISRDISLVDTFSRRAVVVTNPDYMRPFLNIPRSGSPLLSESNAWKFVKNEFGSNNLLTPSIELHTYLKTILDPYFSINAIKEQVPLFLKQTQNRIEEWIRQSDRINIPLEMADFAAEAVIQVLFKGKTEIRPARAIDQLTRSMGYKMLRIPEFFLNKREIQENHAFLNQLIDELLIEKNREGHSLIDGLREHQTKEGVLKDEHLRDSIRFFLFAGMETTSSFLSACIHYLARDPSMQEALLKEMREKGIRQIEDLNAESLNALDLLREFMNRVLREHPPIWGQTRLAEEDLVLYDAISEKAFSIPKGYGIILLHAPVKGGANKIPLNFGAGVNPCIGKLFALWEVRTFLATLLLKAKIEPNGQEPKWEWLSTHHIEGDYFIRLQPH